MESRERRPHHQTKNAAPFSANPNIMQPNKFTTQQTPRGVIYTFASGHVLEIDANFSTATVEFPHVDGCGPIRGIVRNSGDAFHALKNNQLIPDHCKTW